MSLISLNRTIGNDEPDEQQAEQFLGLDLITKPTRLGEGMLQGGANTRCDSEMIRTRPGLRFLSALNHTPINPGQVFVQGLAYYDTPLIERIIAAWNGRLFEIASDNFNTTAIPISGPINGTTQQIQFSQLVDRLLYVDGWIKYLAWNGAAWTSGTVSTFSNTDAMPFFSQILVHRFRALASEQGTDRIYVSAIGQAEAPADWIKTQNVRIGDGEGDPIVALVPSQSGAIYALKQGSVWALDTSDASPANWSSSVITRLAGCIAGRTALAVGQDVFFLSRYGLVSLGALSVDNSISPQSTLSREIQPLIESINWAVASTSWAVTWRDLYILCVPTDGALRPNTLLVFNTQTKRWQTPWITAMPGRTIGDTPVENDGFSVGCVTNFGQRSETILGDACGRVFLIDEIIDVDQQSASASTDIQSFAVTRSWDHGAPSSPKQPFMFEVEFFRGTGRELAINLIKDADGIIQGDPENAELVASGVQTSDTIVANAQANSMLTFPIRFPWQLAPKAINRLKFNVRGSRYREVAAQFICGKGRMQIRAVRMQAFIDAPTLK